MTVNRCIWCEKPFTSRRTGGKAQTYCSRACREAFHAATRSWAKKAIEKGELSVADLKRDKATCTFAGEA